MKKILAEFIKAIIKDILRDCTEGEQLMFKKMYSSHDLDLPIAEVVDNMPKKQLVWAMQQVDRTVEKAQNV